MGKDAKGKPSSPLELLILGAFRYLGRGLTFDDLEESTAISEEVHRKFFHKFIKIGSTVLYDRYVRAPQTKEEVQQHMHEFATAGLPGAFASTDATNIIHELGVWIVVDNGYHNWSTTVPPMSNCVKPEEIRWSAWVESMRKDVGKFISFALINI